MPKAIIIEDDAKHFLEFKAAFESLGYIVITNNGLAITKMETAIQAFKDNKDVQLILIDYNLGESKNDGFTIAEKLSDFGLRNKIIMTSAFVEDTTFLKKLKKFGNTKFISKPNNTLDKAGLIAEIIASEPEKVVTLNCRIIRDIDTYILGHDKAAEKVATVAINLDDVFYICTGNHQTLQSKIPLLKGYCLLVTKIIQTGYVINSSMADLLKNQEFNSQFLKISSTVSINKKYFMGRLENETDKLKISVGNEDVQYELLVSDSFRKEFRAAFKIKN